MKTDTPNKWHDNNIDDRREECSSGNRPKPAQRSTAQHSTDNDASLPNAIITTITITLWCVSTNIVISIRIYFMFMFVCVYSSIIVHPMLDARSSNHNTIQFWLYYFLIIITRKARIKNVWNKANGILGDVI